MCRGVYCSGSRSARNTYEILIYLIDDLEAFQAAVTDGLKEIDINNQSIQNNVGRLVGMVNSRAL